MLEVSVDAGAQIYEAAPDADNVALPSLQITADEGVTVIEGNGFTVTVTVAVPGQPSPPVPVTVYVVVVAGLAVILAPVVALNPTAAAHV
jgi:hypothetical protein